MFPSRCDDWSINMGGEDTLYTITETDLDSGLRGVPGGLSLIHI